jgi:hypothetical protein
MAAAKGNQNAKGNTGGKSLNDRKLAAEVRTLALTEIKKYLEGKEEGYKGRDMKQAIILKLAPSILPRLNEHTGADGEDLFPIPILNDMNVPTHNGNQENSPANETDSGSPGRNLSE